MLSPAALLSHNLLNRIGWFDDRKLLTNRLSVGFVAFASLPFALATDEILELLESALAVGLVALLVPFVAGVFLRPRGELPGLLSIGCGSVLWIAHQIAVLMFASEQSQSGTLAMTLTAIPPELTGLLASIAGYVLGQQYSPARSCSSAL